MTKEELIEAMLTGTKLACETYKNEIFTISHIDHKGYVHTPQGTCFALTSYSAHDCMVYVEPEIKRVKKFEMEYTIREDEYNFLEMIEGGSLCDLLTSNARNRLRYALDDVRLDIVVDTDTGEIEIKGVK